MATVAHVEHEDGSQSIGIKVGKAFVPFVTVAPGHFASLLESAQQAGDAENGDTGAGES